MLHRSVAFRMAHSRVIEPEKIIVVKWPWRNFKNWRNYFQQDGVACSLLWCMIILYFALFASEQCQWLGGGSV